MIILNPIKYYLLTVALPIAVIFVVNAIVLTIAAWMINDMNKHQ